MSDTHFADLRLSYNLRAQLTFIRELDALKNVARRTLLLDRSRTENDAEHSWEMATMTLALAAYIPVGGDILRILKMLLIHDLVEIDAGDAYAYDAAANVGQREREEVASRRIFGLLPDDQCEELRSLWLEFEARQTPDARFARAMDRLQPLLHSYLTEGKTWQDNRVTAGSVRHQMALIGDASPALGDLAEQLIADALGRGFLLADGVE